MTLWVLQLSTALWRKESRTVLLYHCCCRCWGCCDGIFQIRDRRQKTVTTGHLSETELERTVRFLKIQEDGWALISSSAHPNCSLVFLLLVMLFPFAHPSECISQPSLPVRFCSSAGLCSLRTDLKVWFWLAHRDRLCLDKGRQFSKLDQWIPLFSHFILYFKRSLLTSYF